MCTYSIPGRVCVRWHMYVCVCLCVGGKMGGKQRVLYNRCHVMWSLIIVSNSSTWLRRKGGNCYYLSIAEMGAWKSKLTAEGCPASPQTWTGGECRFPNSLSHRTAPTFYQSLKTLNVSTKARYIKSIVSTVHKTQPQNRSKNTCCAIIGTSLHRWKNAEAREKTNMIESPLGV